VLLSLKTETELASKILCILKKLGNGKSPKKNTVS